EGDAALDAGDRLRLPAIEADAPDLGGAVVGRPLVALALAVAEEVHRAPVRRPGGRAVASPVRGEAADLVGLRLHDPEVGLAVVGGLLPAALRVGDVPAVGGHGDVPWCRQGEIVLDGDVVRALGGPG